MRIWRLIQSPAADIFTQMKWDEELFEEILQDSSLPPALRIYRVDKPAVTLSYGSRVAPDAQPETCVRPTGGGRVFHGNDLIYSVVARRDSFPTFGRVRTSYLSLHEAVQAAFSKLGVETELFRCDEPRLRENAKRRIRDCFHEPVPTDVALGRRKVAGGAQRRKGECFLHQGSIQLVKGISFERLREALIEAFEEKFEISWANSNKIVSAV